MWRLALGGVFLAAAQACVFCRLPAHDLSGRLARLCSQTEAGQKECEASPDFSAFALDEMSMNKVTEKTHRVLRVMEIKEALSSLPSYWRWLHNTKLPEYTREGTDAGWPRGEPRVSGKGVCGEQHIHSHSRPFLVFHCSSLSPRLPGQHRAVQLLYLQGDRGVLLASKALLPRSSCPPLPRSLSPWAPQLVSPPPSKK
ncbi:transmembrane protein 95 isoform X1 [Sapajus apella]|uniref:Transmembrane protein 95 isoform X1 n=1 Tax=Sapajus apella TaxID=9515 RepID=A0A6J3I3A1_SAPAP|nr:transmembrane protein 95 isoform X1 [Sapajus apella]